jgi:hypothetical protein
MELDQPSYYKMHSVYSLVSVHADSQIFCETRQGGWLIDFRALAQQLPDANHVFARADRANLHNYSLWNYMRSVAHKDGIELMQKYPVFSIIYS